MINKSKKAQEEMVGFALIMIVVAVVILIFLAFSLRDSETDIVESYEVESFIQSTLQYTTECRDNLNALTIQNLIFKCENGELCKDGTDTCQVLISELEEITEKSWPVGEDRPVKGYLLEINVGDNGLISLNKGNMTSNLKGSTQLFPRELYITFKAYILGTTILH